MFNFYGQGEYELHKKIRDNPDIIRDYFQTGKMPVMRASQKQLFLNIIELFRTIQTAGMLDKVLGDPNLLEKQLSLFET